MAVFVGHLSLPVVSLVSKSVLCQRTYCTELFVL